MTEKAKFLSKADNWSKLIAKYKKPVVMVICLSVYRYSIVYARQGNLSRFMQSLITSFCISMNSLRGKSGLKVSEWLDIEPVLSAWGTDAESRRRSY